ncbi:MAG: hypothetical protein HY906_28165 [Deltaproteobacteria bacterium]|nr:hypothetical protein [Deltaproteobacteria bacterium]
MRALAYLLAPALVGGLGGCSLNAMTGNMMADYSVKHVVPYVFETGDVDMACKLGVSMGPFLLSFGRVTTPPDRSGIVTMLSAGMCAEADAREAELDQLRALKTGRAAEAQDARVREHRAHEAAAARYQVAFQRFVRVFGEPGGGCRPIAKEDELLYLLGLTGGLLSVFHDRAAGGALGVPMDIPRKVAAGAACLDDGKFWGVPRALQAAVWASVPGSAPAGSPDPFVVLQQSARAGQEKGLRLAGAFLAQIAANAGKSDTLRTGIREHAAAVRNKPALEAYRTLDRYATMLVEHESDKLWTQATGHRTPVGSFGTFPEDETKPPGGESDDKKDDSLLEGLETEQK